MKNFIETIIAATLATVVILVAIPLFTLGGGLTGYIVGWFFGDQILPIFAPLGFHSMWQLGAVLGFVGSFIRPHDPD